jgi:hypothetical protein
MYLGSTRARTSSMLNAYSRGYKRPARALIVELMLQNGRQAMLRRTVLAVAEAQVLGMRDPVLVLRRNGI